MTSLQESSTGRKGIGAVVVIAFVLLVAVTLVLRQKTGAGRFEHVHAADLLPSVPPSWRIRDLPLGETERVQDAMSEQLNFTSAVFRRYDAGDRTLYIYVSYWAPGKQPPRLVAAHTPDICWVVAGWRLVTATHAPAWVRDAVGVAQPHFRCYEMARKTQSVMFWHRVGRRVAQYGTSREDWGKRHFLNELFDRSLMPTAESQLFVRVSVEGDWSSWRESAEVFQFLHSLASIVPPGAE